MSIVKGTHGLYYGTSPDLPGTLIAGNSEDAVSATLNRAKELLSQGGGSLPGHVLRMHEATGQRLYIPIPDKMNNSQAIETIDRLKVVVMEALIPMGHS